MRYAQLVMGPAGSGKVSISDFTERRLREWFDLSSVAVAAKIPSDNDNGGNVKALLFQTYKCDSGSRRNRAG